MFLFFNQIVKISQILCAVITVLLIMPITQVKAEIPTYQLDQEKHLVGNYLYRLVSDPQQNKFNEINDFIENEWQETHLTNGDLLILSGENWFAFQLFNNTKTEKQAYLEVANLVRMNNVDLYIKEKNKPVEQKIMALQRSNNRIAKVTLAPYTHAILYLTIESPTQLRSSVMLYSEQAYIKDSSTSQFLQGIVIGGIFCLFLSFILLFLATGNKLTFILSGYFLSNALMLSVMLGINLYYFYPDLPELIGIEFPVLTTTLSILLLVFSVKLFSLKTNFYKIYKWIKFSIFGLLLYIPLSIQLSVVDNINISMVVYELVIFALILVGIYLYKHATRLALLYVFSMLTQLLCVFIFIVLSNWFDTGFVANRSLFYGMTFWINCLLITFILSRQYHYHLQDKKEVQQRALTNALASEKAKEELFILQTQSQEELENRVQERTLELNIALQELEEANHELEQKNTLDELTGLFNRRFYDQKIIAEYRRSKRNLTPLSLVLIDIDHFKLVNDTYGHLAGDQCLVWISKHIKQSLKRSSDMAFRYGGEEFCLILPDTDGKGAVALAEALRENVGRDPCIYKEVSIPITISNGIFTYLQQDNILPEQIFSKADKALYQAKHDGRNQTQECKES